MKKYSSITPFQSKVYIIVKSIPQGKVTTYSDIAKKLGNKHLAQAVGNALHKNPFAPTVPCHRVVNNQGRLAKKFSNGGINKQRKLLGKENIKIYKDKVDLKRYLIL